MAGGVRVIQQRRASTLCLTSVLEQHFIYRRLLKLGLYLECRQSSICPEEFPAASQRTSMLNAKAPNLVVMPERQRGEAVLRGVRLGADDYLVEPFNPPELVAVPSPVFARSKELPKLPIFADIAARFRGCVSSLRGLS
jgi:hypothetical protein